MTRVQRLFSTALAGGFALLIAACAGNGNLTPDLVFVSTRDGDYAIYSMSSAGDGQKRLTEAGGDPSSPGGLFFQIEPAWSPDGGRIAFASKREGTFDLYVMNGDGTGTRRLTSTREDDGHPTWSPRGDRIAFSRGIEGDIYVMNADGSAMRRITENGAAETQPAWSPDGRWIAYVKRTPGTELREVWLVRPDGSGERRLTSLGAASYSPAWSPDGTRIAFSTDYRADQFDIYFVVVAGGDLQQATTSPDDSFEPAWSPDGETIAFSEGGSIYSVESEGDPAELTASSGNDSSPTWKPAFEAGR
ncbi:MAG: hypothetical protein WD015_04390 [Gaiellaceae bacterium]